MSNLKKLPEKVYMVYCIPTKEYVSSYRGRKFWTAKQYPEKVIQSKVGRLFSTFNHQETYVPEDFEIQEFMLVPLEAE